METKHCNKCDTPKPISDFYMKKRRHKEGGRIPAHFCKPCLLESNRDYRFLNRDKYNRLSQEKRFEKKDFAIEYLGGVCSSCKGTFHRCVYDFHHRDPATKDMDATQLLNISKEAMTDELDKCVLLCANCHRLEHFNHDTTET